MKGYIEFNFPRARFVGTNTPADQIQHVLSEADEVRQAFVDDSAPLNDLITELADLTHSLETYWRIMINKFGTEFVENVFDQVEKKNSDRGYYAQRKWREWPANSPRQRNGADNGQE